MRKASFGFLLFDDFEDLDFMGPWEIIATWSQQFSGPEKLLLISENGTSARSSKGLSHETQYDFNSCPYLDYLLIPGGDGTREEVYKSNASSKTEISGHLQESQLEWTCHSHLLSILLDKKQLWTYNYTRNISQLVEFTKTIEAITLSI